MKTNIISEVAFLRSIDFSSNIINSIPGFVYLYELVGDKMRLRKWNNFHTEVLGYPADEMYDKDVSTFFSKKEMKKIRIGVADAISKEGTAQIEAIAHAKDGTVFPGIFTGYVFNNNGSTYLVGVGVVISREKQIERKLVQSRLAKKKQEVELARSKRELVSTALHISSTAEVITDVLKKLNDILPRHAGCGRVTDIISIQNILESHLRKQDNWEMFKVRFTEVHRTFFKKIKKKHPDLTKSELKFCAYLRIHLSSDQIAAALNISKEGIRKARYRIRKKIGLDPKKSLEQYISKF